MWASLIPAALLNGRAFLSGLPNNFYLGIPHGIVGAITALFIAFVHQIDWWRSFIFLIVMWFSVTLSTIISAMPFKPECNLTVHTLDEVNNSLKEG
ncbi:hypothetical protein [Abyssogena phaseoliformis symbiont]|uniref:hypothetical protein n=1 Tax=Abyssogena phaseoliformis symbiont TaxID=596095 RepID=UPI001914F46F|nr:hypothetical protein [Abyssogena phaseoliformis symbiont]MBW5289221.1 hypothetical protein [Candidatus Ruthia sp. Apha_13_S6]